MRNAIDIAIENKLSKFIQDTQVYHNEKNLKSHGEYSKKSCKKNPRNYYLRALTSIQVGYKKTWENTEDKIDFYEKVVKDIKRGIKQNPEQANFGHFLIAICPLNSKYQHLKKIKKSRNGNNFISELNNFNFFNEAQYLLGLIYQRKQDYLKSFTALITAALNGHQEAASLIAAECQIQNQGGIYHLEFSHEVSTKMRYKILQSLYANKVITKQAYLHNLDVIEAQAEKGSPLLTRTLAKIHYQLILNSPYNRVAERIRNAQHNPNISADKKIQKAKSLVEKGVKQYIQKEKDTAKFLSSTDLLENYLDFAGKIIYRSAFISGAIFGTLTAIVEIPLVFTTMGKYIFFSDRGPGDAHFLLPVASQTNRTLLGRRVSDSYLYFSETGLAFLGAWFGRAIGFGLSVVILTLATLIAYPLYSLAKRNLVASTKEKELNQKSKPELFDLAQNEIKETFEEAAKKSLKNKGENSNKKYLANGLSFFRENVKKTETNPTQNFALVN